MSNSTTAVVERSAVFQVAQDCEIPMLKIKDIALILHEFMGRRARLSAEEQVALCWVTNELVDLGDELQDLNSRIYKLGGAKCV